MTLLIIGICGLLGVFSRYGVDLFVSRYMGTFPVGTLLINLVGSFLAGLVFVAGVERQLLNADWKNGLMVGFCGGFTTFSAYALQSVVQWEAGARNSAALYFIASPLLGLLCAILGLYAGRIFLPAS